MLAAACLMTGCGTTPNTISGTSSGSTAKPVSQQNIGPGMNERGEVIDSREVENGYGQKVRGLDDWEGEITGTPAPGSKFTKLQIGMNSMVAMSIVGQPDSDGAHLTGKVFIPFFYGSDRFRYEAVYKGMGRLIFAGSAGFDSNSHLIWIIHNMNETGAR